MAGCYGNHPEDRHFLKMLNDHLEENDRNEDEEDLEVDEGDTDEEDEHNEDDIS